MLRQRVITATFLLTLFAVSLFIGPWAFALLAAAAMALTMWEWLKLAGWSSTVSIVCGVILAICLYVLEIFVPEDVNPFYDPTVLFYLSLLSVIIWLVQSIVMIFKRTSGWKVPKVWIWLSAWILIPCMWFFMMYIYREFGITLMISVMAIVWFADMAAYFGGTTFGGPKMSPGISPKKTWAGAISAFVCVLVLAYICFVAWPSAYLWTNIVISRFGHTIASILICFAVFYSIMGDLFESAIKRTADVKDSGNLLPGHGGAFDRLDAQFAEFPLAMLILLLV